MMTEQEETKRGLAGERGTRRYLPAHDPTFVAEFVTEYFDDLTQEARRSCWKHNIPDFADDALSITIEKFMASHIEDRGPRSAIAFAVTILKNSCIDEIRRRGRQAVLAGSLTGDLGGEDAPGTWIPEPASPSNPEQQVLATLELHAVSMGFERLPEAMSATHKNVARDLEIVKRRYLHSMSWEEIADEMDIDKTHRQSAARGRELLRGWVHALCGTQPEPEAINRKYWQRGFDAGELFRETSVAWPPARLRES